MQLLQVRKFKFVYFYTNNVGIYYLIRISWTSLIQNVLSRLPKFKSKRAYGSVSAGENSISNDLPEVETLTCSWNPFVSPL